MNTNRITIRGVGARTLYGTDKLRLYYNDIPITNGSGFSTIESFDLENLSSVEVIKGPKATNYGANLGGAILLNSKQPTNESTYFRNNFTIGSYSLVKNNLQFSLKENKVALNFHYGFLETDGYRENNRFEREGVLLDLNYQITPKTNIGLLFNHVDYNAQIPSSLGETDFKENPTKAAFTWKSAKGYEDNKYSLAGLTLNHAFQRKINNTTSIFYSYLDHYEPRPFEFWRNTPTAMVSGQSSLVHGLPMALKLATILVLNYTRINTNGANLKIYIKIIMDKEVYRAINLPITKSLGDSSMLLAIYLFHWGRPFLPKLG